jgi:peptide/nickel transport system substrate-binding protein
MKLFDRRSFLCGLCLVAFALAGLSPRDPVTPKAQAADHIKIGLLEEPKTLNVWLATDAWSQKVLSQIYQYLFIRDPKTLNLIPWLAEGDPVYDPDALSYTIKLRSIKWSDGTDLTSEDVAFTGEVINEFKVPRFLSNWNFIKKIETPDKHTVKFYLKEPKAIFLTRTLTTPVVQKKAWEGVVEEARKTEKPLTTLLNYKVENPVGCGPFVLEEWRQGAFIFLKKNPLFFGTGKEISGYLLGPYLDGIVFKIYGTSDAAVLALKKGSIDMFWWDIQAGYVEDLKARSDLQVFSSEKSALYYLGFNVRRAPFNDVHLRQAVATLIDKDFITSRILQGHGTKMWSIIPQGNEFWYCPDVPRHGDGLNREERIKKAYEILKGAGYSWDAPPVDDKGRISRARGFRGPDGRPVAQITLLTPPADYDPHRAMVGMMIQEWLKAFGIPAVSRPMAFGSLLEQVKVRHDFDAFVMGYGNLSLDPDYLRNFFLSENDKPQGWNMSGYRNPEFDRIAEESSAAMDLKKRRELILEMQKIIMRDIPYVPLYYPQLTEAVRKKDFDGWVQMLGGIGNLWSFCQLKPQ